MTKSLIQGLAVASTVMVLVAGVGTINLAEAVTQSELAQSAGSTQSDRMLQVALPEFATVRLTQGGSYTGELTGFSSDNLTLSVSGQSMTLAHSQIREVAFTGNVWIPGEPNPYRIRGISLSLEDVPVSALAWNGSSSLASTLRQK